MKRTGVLLAAGLLLLAGCTSKGQIMDGPGMVRSYLQIDQETAALMMEQEEGCIVVDVRTIEEYESGHIPGAICIPNERIGAEPPEELPDFYQKILVYCRSGNRSKQAAEALFDLGYANVCEFGGILDWKGEIVTGQTVMLTVESNPTTGFSWAAEQDQDLFDVRSYFVSEPQEEPVDGSGGWEIFLLTPKQAGTARLTMTLSRPWEPGETDTQITCMFEIADDLTITVTEDGAEQGRECGFVPEIRVF